MQMSLHEMIYGRLATPPLKINVAHGFVHPLGNQPTEAGLFMGCRVSSWLMRIDGDAMEWRKRSNDKPACRISAQSSPVLSRTHSECLRV